MLGDWDGNGKANLGVWTPDTGVFTLRVGKRSTSHVPLGSASDQPVAGDWDGDGLWEVGVRTPATGTWRLRGADGSLRSVVLGDAGDIPVTGDWDGDGRTDLGVFDQSTATFTLRREDADGLVWTAQGQFGQPGDLPVAGDWDGNATTEVGVWTPATATFSERRAASATAAREPSSYRSEPKATLPGSRIGFLNAQSTVTASGRRFSSAATHRARLHMPCAIWRGKPSAFAVTGYRWIGLWSPETAAY